VPNHRKPKALHILQGTFRSDRHANESPHAPPADPKLRPPKSLGKAGKAAWREWYVLLCEVGIMAELDVAAFEMLCGTFDEVQRCDDALANDGHFLHLDNGSQKLHPAVGEKFRWLALQRDLMRDFGLTSEARQKLRIDPATVPQAKRIASRDRGAACDDLDEFLEGMQG
jgi:P27 family predicted phage terminase small subunit